MHMIVSSLNNKNSIYKLIIMYIPHYILYQKINQNRLKPQMGSSSKTLILYLSLIGLSFSLSILTPLSSQSAQSLHSSTHILHINKKITFFLSVFRLIFCWCCMLWLVLFHRTILILFFLIFSLVSCLSLSLCLLSKLHLYDIFGIDSLYNPFLT